MPATVKKVYNTAAWDKLIKEKQNAQHGYDAIACEYTSLQVSALRTINNYYEVKHVFETYLIDTFLIYVVTIKGGDLVKFRISPLGLYTQKPVFFSDPVKNAVTPVPLKINPNKQLPLFQ